MSTRREFIKLSTAAATVATTAKASAMLPKTSATRPNIVVFLTDDHGQWAQRAYGNSELKTPNMDRLASKGTRMTQAFTPCPVCSPARASFFTGRMPSQHGMHDYLNENMKGFNHPGLEGQTLISELFKKAGYSTALVGKWHCGGEREPQPGFDRWFSYWVNQYPHEGMQRFSDQGKQVNEQGPQSPLLTARAIDFIQAHKKTENSTDAPFFLFISYVDTHGPHKQAPKDLVEEYMAASFRDIPNETLPACHGTPRATVDADPQAEHHKRAEYYAAVGSLDREVGKVLKALETAGQLDNTLLVYTGDHGLNCGQHGIWEKGNTTIPQNFLEESIRIACTVSWPEGGVRQNATSESLVNLNDLWATLLDIGGAIPDPKTSVAINSPGVSFVRQLRGQPVSTWRKTIMSEYGNARMARTDRYKLILRYPYGGVVFPHELYDLQKDPRETTNVYTDPALQSVVTHLSGEITEFYAKYSIPGRTGLELDHQPLCAGDSPWILAAKQAAHV